MRSHQIGAFLIVATLSGCGGGSESTVTGKVIYEGEPVKAGYVTFQPADGQGPSAAGEITEGTYTVAEITSGKKIVKVDSSEPPAGPVSTEELAKAAADKKKARKFEMIPTNAEGNNATVEVKVGPNSFDFALKRPTKK